MLPLVKQEFLKTLKGPPGPNGVNDVTTFYGVPVNCISKAKLINFEFKCKEAYATYACDSGDYINEFTYTGNDNRKCFFIDYKKSWGVEPMRTLEPTMRYFIDGPSTSIFDSPACSPTDR